MSFSVGYSAGFNRTTMAATASPSGSTLTSTSGSLVDVAGSIWTLVQSANRGLQIAINGQTDTTTSNVKLLLTLNGNTYQENTANSWYQSTGGIGHWVQIGADPRVMVLITNFHSVVATAGSVALTWAATPSVAGTVVHYQVMRRVSGTFAWSISSSTTNTSLSIGGLLPGTDYDFCVVASV